MKKMYIALAAFLMTAVAFSQTVISGTILEEGTNSPLPGASVIVQGTTNGTSTDFDGNFTIEVSENSGTLVVSYIGFVSKKVPFTSTGSIGVISLEPNAEELEGVIVTGVQDIAKDRKTPVAVSTIKFAEIQEKLGSQELPEILNTTPSIYATKSGGGFGDGRVNIRGFDTNNSAVMINGIPVNDMENGRVFWSNWAGLSDVTSAIQVQRGLGSSKLAVSSVGGTINVVTKTSQNPKGGSFGATVGNDGYVKTLASYSSGILENGFSTSLLLSRTGGNMYADGTNFEGYNFFVGLGYTSGDHSLEFMVTGAPQWHNRRGRATSIEQQIQYGKGDGEPNRRYNESWGRLDGEEYTFAGNFYHKPVISLSWNWELSSKTTLQTNAYASFGRGGSLGEIGEIGGRRQFALPRTADGLIRVDDIKAFNSGTVVADFNGGNAREQIDGQYVNNSDRNPNENNTNGITRRSSINSHNWYGLLANFNNRISDKLTIDFGVDIRKYKGFHYRRVNDLLGGDVYQQTDDRNNPLGEGASNLFTETYAGDAPWWVFSNIDDEEKIDYYNTGFVNWLGVFAQVEYNFTEDVTGFIQGALSNQGFAREEFFGETPPEKTDFENILGGNVKSGLNWNINENHNLFANAGYYSKQPLFDAVYLNFSNSLNPDLTNEIIVGFELGYGYRSSKFRANVNLYRTSWKDRFDNVTATFNRGEPDEVRGTGNILGITQVHSGLEFDARLQASDKLSFTGMVSIGNWEYKDNITATFFDNDQSPIVIDGVEQTQVLNLDGVKVGDAAQFTAAMGVNYNILENLAVDLGYRYADNLYADFDITRIDENGSLKLPSFGLTDAGVSFKLPIGENALNFRVNVNNLFDTTYIAESDTNDFAEAGDETYDGINVSNRVFFGFGRTWNASVRFNF
ncbi:TonB-dependent receptor [uncultured Maribacter sp.]|uniref:TonB-dependent receptor n=1 Tax=uncultured Maribacter sp. TaxID=431308 RepID=UPI0026097E10|nr:TonB-dependent receptor [uncultured Maribacter sp.]